jgi:hypothetical protein
MLSSFGHLAILSKEIVVVDRVYGKPACLDLAHQIVRVALGMRDGGIR